MTASDICLLQVKRGYRTMKRHRVEAMLGVAALLVVCGLGRSEDGASGGSAPHREKRYLIEEENSVKIQDYPYMVSIWHRFTMPEVTTLKFGCAGCLITVQHILSVGLCSLDFIFEKEDSNEKGLLVRIKSSMPDWNGDEYLVIKVTRNPRAKGYNEIFAGYPAPIHKDFLVLQIRRSSQTITSRDTINFASYADAWNMDIMVMERRTCFTLGWGNWFNMTYRLRKTDLILSHWTECAKWFQYDVEVTKRLKITEREVICAKPTKTPSSCPGDMGGPLVCNGKVFGISTWLIGCGNGVETAYVFMRADAEYEFILQETSQIDDSIFSGENVRENIKYPSSQSTRVLSIATNYYRLWLPTFLISICF